MGVEVGGRVDSQDDEQVAKHCDQIQAQEQLEEVELHFVIFWGPRRWNEHTHGSIL